MRIDRVHFGTRVAGELLPDFLLHTSVCRNSRATARFLGKLNFYENPPFLA